MGSLGDEVEYPDQSHRNATPVIGRTPEQWPICTSRDERPDEGREIGVVCRGRVPLVVAFAVLEAVDRKSPDRCAGGGVGRLTTRFCLLKALRRG
jgi:hypothetical protein